MELLGVRKIRGRTGFFWLFREKIFLIEGWGGRNGGRGALRRLLCCGGEFARDGKGEEVEIAPRWQSSWLYWVLELRQWGIYSKENT